MADGLNLGFVSTRFAGLDGVSLETEKWAHVLEKMGHHCFYFAGELDRPSERSYLVPEAHFQHPSIRSITRNCFGVEQRSPEMTETIQYYKSSLKNALYRFIEQFDIDVLVPQNALAIPMNLPLGIALTELLSETRMFAFAHHHDFYWERKRFMTNAVWDYLDMAFPPMVPQLYHIVINSSADRQLGFRSGHSATVIPNVMDFSNPPPEMNAYAADLRETLGLASDEYLILQPTRIVQRKGIEHAVELVHRLREEGVPCRLVISHAAGDEGMEYEKRIRRYAELLDVPVVFFGDRVNDNRGSMLDGRKIYALEDLYQNADLVTYPSYYEGFGNAFLEAVYYGKPLVVNNYSIYAYDIKPKGFQCIEMDGYVTDRVVAETADILKNRDKAEAMVQANYQKADCFFSFEVLERKLQVLLDEIMHLV